MIHFVGKLLIISCILIVYYLLNKILQILYKIQKEMGYKYPEICITGSHMVQISFFKGTQIF